MLGKLFTGVLAVIQGQNCQHSELNSKKSLVMESTKMYRFHKRYGIKKLCCVIKCEQLVKL